MPIPTFLNTQAAPAVPRAIKYKNSVAGSINQGRANALNTYLKEYGDFWCIPVTGPNQQGQPVTSRGQNSDLTPTDKLLLLDTDAAEFLGFAATAYALAAAINPGTTVPSGSPTGYRFLPDSDDSGRVYIQQAAIGQDGSTVTWSYVKPSAAGLAAAAEIGLSIPTVLR